MVVKMVVKNRGPDLYEHGSGVANRQVLSVTMSRRVMAGWLALSRSRPTRIRPRALEAHVRHRWSGAPVPSPRCMPCNWQSPGMGFAVVRLRTDHTG